MKTTKDVIDTVMGAFAPGLNKPSVDAPGLAKEPQGRVVEAEVVKVTVIDLKPEDGPPPYQYLMDHFKPPTGWSSMTGPEQVAYMSGWHAHAELDDATFMEGVMEEHKRRLMLDEVTKRDGLDDDTEEFEMGANNDLTYMRNK